MIDVREIKLNMRYPDSQQEDITEAFTRGYTGAVEIGNKAIEKLKAENAKLRELLSESRQANERMYIKIKRYKNVLRTRPISMNALFDENTKLRELATEAIRLMQADGPDCGLCKHYSECWTDEAMDYSPSGCVICDEARKLGIELD